MSSVPQYYLTLFNSVSEAIESMESQNYGTAKRILLRGQYEAEAEFVLGEEQRGIPCPTEKGK